MKKTTVSNYQIDGKVIDINTKLGIAGLRVEAWDKDLLFNDLVGSAVTDSGGNFHIEFGRSYFKELFLDREPDLFFRVFSGGKLIKSTQDSILWNARSGTPVEIAVPWTNGDRGGDDAIYTVVGAVSSPDRAGVGDLRVQIVDKNIGQDTLLTETHTDARGNYQATFAITPVRALGKDHPDLQARVFSGQDFVAASETRYNATNQETLNVRLPANSTALASEYETLIAAIATYYSGPLRDLKETDERQDITYLANKSGWDARAVALAALADQFSSHTPAIKPAFYYALFRAGLPANADTLYQADLLAVEQVWKQAVQGVIPRSLESEIPAALQAFKNLGAARLLSAPPQAGTSSLKDVLAVSQLAESQHQQFAELYTAHRNDLPTFWTAISNAFGAETSNRLQLNGKLGFLTINNAQLMTSLHQSAGATGLNDPVQLVQNGFHRAEKWSELLNGDVSVPKEIPGENAAKKRENYAEFLAAQMRISYPTATVAELVRSGELPVGLSQRVHSFLSENHGKFEIGTTPVQQYLVKNNIVLAPETVTEVKRLQRVYQLTSSDRAMTGLLSRGVDSAFQVVSLGKQAFVRSFSDDLGGESAALVYDRSAQVHNAVLNVAVSYLTARNGFTLGSESFGTRGNDRNENGFILDSTPQISGGGGNGDGNGAAGLIAYPTLEQLFGEMDFCACDHCRSILSPAAYLVDLLLFIDQPIPPSGSNPQAVLFNRRPDIQHLPLTCENTNTAMPYIDVVNETLEYFIANDVLQFSLVDYVGHDTDLLKTEDLLASPQFVMDSAYTILRDERFPLPLPFHQPLENLRRNFEKFEVPLPLAMEKLRQNDNLERGANAYGWRDTRIEEVRISRSEHEILTDSTAVPLWRMYGFPSGTSDANVIAGISNYIGLVHAKDFTRRMGITYMDLAAILRTRFINPNIDLLPKVERLGVPFAALKKLKDTNTPQGNQEFDDLLPEGAAAPDPAEYDGDIKAWVRKQENFDRIMAIITLTDPAGGDDQCNFDHLELRYARPMSNSGDTSNRIGAVEFVRLLRFIRLWRRLGWTIEQTDAVICALFPVPPFPLAAGAIDTVAKLDTAFLTLLPRLGVVAGVMKALNLNTNRDLLPLLACWSPLGTQGETALYRRMFLDPTLLKQDPVFADNGYGEFLKKVQVAYVHTSATLEAAIIAAGGGLLSYNHTEQRLSYAGLLDTTVRNALTGVAGVPAQFITAVNDLYAGQRLNTHAEALRSALNLSADEFLLIFDSLSFNADTPLTIENISAIYRRGWLARKLKLSVLEFLLLVQLTGLDPFAGINATQPAILRLAELVVQMRDRALKSSAALYLIWNQDLSGKSAPDAATITGFARTLRLDFDAIETEFSVTDDPDGAIAQSRMTLVYGTEAATFFFGLLNDAFSVDTTFSDPDANFDPGPTRTAIEAAAGNTQAGTPRVVYDDFRKRLTFVGELNATTQGAMKTAAGLGAVAFGTAVDALFAKSDAAVGPFFAKYPELRPVLNSFMTSPDPVAQKRGAVLAQILPDLIRRRKREQALQAISAVAQTSLDFARVLLDVSVYGQALDAANDVTQPALNDILALETQGLSAQFFANTTATGTIIPFTGLADKLSYTPLVLGVGNPLPANPTAGAAISGVWSGYLEAPATGFFKLIIETDLGANVTLDLDDETIPLTLTGQIWENTDVLELSAGTLYEIRLTVENVTNDLKVQWEWEPKGQGREVVPARYLYAEQNAEAFRRLFIRFLKAASLSTTLRLTANETAFLATADDYAIDPLTGLPDANGPGWINHLPTEDNLHLNDPAAAAIAQALNRTLTNVLSELLDYARIKSELSPADESLLKILEDPTAATAQADSLLFTLTRWDSASLNDLLTHFADTIPGLSHFRLFRRINDAFSLGVKMGISISALIRATTNEPTGDSVRDLQAALRARYDPADWRTVVQPVNDSLRSLQRDALVAFILHKMSTSNSTAHIDTSDKLFEYFLMDVEMAPCMQTSRIRHALSSVQLFIERCLMNLETEVGSSAINGKQWEWMKRYRVWEANRKVFLYPENWLEPELRDDKSPFFKEIESELLQSDITEESASVALLNYLSKLEEVAKLEICGIYHEPEGERTNSVDHVIARTAGANRKYFYRRKQDGSWTAWELIKLDIEDNPVLPVIWRGRLFLFWLRILKKVPLEAPSLPPAGTPMQGVDANSLIKNNVPEVSVEAILCWSEYFKGKWQPTRTSDTDRPLSLGSSKSNEFDRSKLQMSVMFWTRGEARIIVSNEVGTGASFFLHNVYSTPELRNEKKNKHYAPRRIVETEGVNTLKISYPFSSLSHSVVDNSIEDRSIDPHHPTSGDPWDVPFFYEDRRHVFYVTTEDPPARVTTWTEPGIFATPAVTATSIPPLVFEKAFTLPDPAGPITRQPGFGVADPSPMTRFVSEDAYIHVGFGTMGTVSFDEKEIGPTGSQVRAIANR